MPEEDAKPKCFIAMPISVPDHLLEAYGGNKAHFTEVLEDLLIPAVTEAGYDAVPPKVKGSAVIHSEIIANLESCAMVLCDVSAHNPNVFLELGIRTAINKPVVLVKDKRTEDLPFDIGPVNTLDYSHSLKHRAVEADRLAITGHINDTTGDSNALYEAFRMRIEVQQTIEQGDPDSPLGWIAERLEGIDRRLDQASTQGPRKYTVTSGAVWQPGQLLRGGEPPDGASEDGSRYIQETRAHFKSLAQTHGFSPFTTRVHGGPSRYVIEVRGGTEDGYLFLVADANAYAASIDATASVVQDEG